MMTTKEKKEVIILVILLIVVAFVVYFNFFKKPDPGNQVFGVPDAVEGPAVSAGGFLPNGPSLDLDILEDAKLKALIAPKYPTVTKDEVGQTNPFRGQ